MRLMHTRLPDFYQKVIDAGKKLRPETEVTITGLENMQTAKLASLRVGRVEEEVLEPPDQKGGSGHSAPGARDHPHRDHQGD